MLRQCHRKCHAPETGLVWALLVLLAFVLFPGCGRGGGGSSAPSSPTPPATLPLNIEHSVELKWDASESSGVQTYRIYRGSQSGGPYTMIGRTSAETRTFSDTNVQSGNTYFYVVTAVREDMIESSYSNEARALVPRP
ncbi:MAG TPA: hypothetical protein VJT08_00025 [Terriglobales bacterium]|nr:hypothetical protein [Terriglobales bacterium]